jgi:hypothetical protein
VVTTEEIRDTLEVYYGKGDRYRNHAIRNTLPLDLPEAELPIDPYLLGIWLGDGTTKNSQITTADPEVLDAFRSAGYELVPGAESGRSRSYYVGRGADGVAFMTRLRAAGVLGDKHVPAAYLRASREQRLALLQGLMDSDGTIGAGNNRCSFSVTKEHLVDAAEELAVGMGWAVTRRKRPAKFRGVEHGVAYYADFSPTEPVFRIPRKAERQKLDSTRNEQHRRRFVVAVEPVEPVPVRCIQVDSPNHLFLAGRQMVPTHNTNQVQCVIGSVARTNDAIVMVIDIPKRGKFGRPWVDSWVQGQASRPIVDWIAHDADEALRMTNFALEVIGQRAIDYNELEAQVDDDKVPVSPEVPEIIIFIDEGAEVMGLDIRDPTLRQVSANLEEIVRTGGGLAVNCVVSVLRATVDTLPTGLKKNANLRIGMRVVDEDEVRFLFGWDGRLDIADAPYPGCGFERENQAPVRPFRGWLMKPSRIRQISVACADRRPDMDEVSLRVPSAYEWKSRWERVLPVLYGPTAARQVLARGPYERPAQAARSGHLVSVSAPVEGGHGGADVRPAGGHGATDWSGHEPPPAPAGVAPRSGPGQRLPTDILGDINEALDAAERALGGQGSADPDDATTDLDQAERMWAQPEAPEPRRPPPRRESETERRARTKRRVFGLLHAAGPEGATVAQLMRALDVEDLAVPENTLRNWLRTESVDLGYSRWGHPAFSPRRS